MLENSLIIVIEWIFFAYMSYRIGNKLNIKESYPWYIIPLWNFWILAKNSEIKLKDFSLIVMMVILLLFLIFDNINNSSAMSIISGADDETLRFIANRLAGELFYSFLDSSLPMVKFGVIAIFWGVVARGMGKEFGVYMVLGLFSIYIPPLLLAFDKLNRLIALSSIYSPLSEADQEVLEKKNSIPIEKMNRVVSIGILLLIFLSIIYWV